MWASGLGLDRKSWVGRAARSRGKTWGKDLGPCEEHTRSGQLALPNLLLLSPAVGTWGTSVLPEGCSG